MLFEGTDVRHRTLELMQNEISALCDGITDTWRYIRNHQHQYHRRLMRFWCDVEVSGWVVIIRFGA